MDKKIRSYYTLIHRKKHARKKPNQTKPNVYTVEVWFMYFYVYKYSNNDDDDDDETFSIPRWIHRKTLPPANIMYHAKHCAAHK